MKRLRLSNTAINYFDRKDLKGLVDYLRGKRFEPTKAMKDGLKYDDEACDFVLKNNRLPDIFGGKEVVNPRVQWKFEQTVTFPGLDPVDFVGVSDVYDLDRKILIELKTGTTSPAYYAKHLQVPLYLTLLNMRGVNTKKAYIAHYDQYLDKTTIIDFIVSDGLIESTKKKLEEKVRGIQEYLKFAGFDYERQNRGSN